MKTRMEELSGGTTGSGRRNERLLRVGEHHVWIRGGVLHLPVEMLNPFVVLMGATRLHILDMADGRTLVFMRAAEFIAAAPEEADLVKRIAARFECGV